MKRAYWLIYLLPLCLLVTTFSSCRKEKMLEGPVNLNFSQDTIIFDTVFTTVGSTTQFFQVYNTNNQPITISSISLQKGSASNFRLNVDGVPGEVFYDVEIPANDSIFIFVEVTVDPTSQNNPLIITDAILFQTGGTTLTGGSGSTQKVDLVAWGQDAYFYTPVVGSGSNAYALPCNLVLANDKPHVFYGYAVVDSGCTLTIPAGTKLHFHPNSGLIIYKGSLQAQGLLGNEILFQGDRLEFTYSEIPGQWDGIHFIQAKNSLLEHCVIKNGFYGVWSDTSFNSSEQIDLKKLEIRNQASIGVYVNAGARVFGENLLVTNCGAYALAATYGGDFKFTHCTFANYWTEDERSEPSVFINNWYTYNSSTIVRPLNFELVNCIIYGNKDKEYKTDLQTGSSLTYTVNTCYIRTDEDLSDGTHYINVFKNSDPGLVDPNNNNYQLLPSSNCIGQGIPTTVTEDILDVPRIAPDIGCYEH